MKWLELSITAPPEYVEPLSEVFRRYGHGGVAVEQAGGFNPDEGETPPEGATVVLRTYLPLDGGEVERRARIDVAVRLVAALAPIGPLRERVLEEEEWAQAWKRHLGPLRVGRRLLVLPTWVRHRPRPAEVVVRLDPGMAFGTGHHPTTRMCLALVEELVKPGDEVLDVGTGSGILSIAAVLLGARRALGLDVDAVAVEAARRNARDNGVGDRFLALRGSLSHPEARPSSFDLALANISARVVIQLAPELAAALKPGGLLVASGVLTDRAAQVEEALTTAGLTTMRRATEGDWATLVARREG